MIDIEKMAHSVMDIRVYALTMKEVLDWAEEAVGSEKPHMIATANAEMIMTAQTDKELGHILNHADMVVPDGAGVLWAGETLGTPFPERVTGADLSVELLKIAGKKGWKVYFLGGAPGVAKKAADCFMKDHGAFSLVGCHDGISMKRKKRKLLRISKRAVPTCFWSVSVYRSRRNGSFIIKKNWARCSLWESAASLM